MTTPERASTKDLDRSEDVGAPLVRLSGVDKIFETRSGHDSIRALSDLSFDVQELELISIVGRSGCGKSTLLKLIAGILAPTRGEVVVYGQPVTGPVRGIGMVFQSPILLSWRTVLRNVLLTSEILRADMRVAEERARRYLELVGLAGFEDRYPSELSGGMQQRVALCRALVPDPPILLMDEPFAALDALTRDEMVIELLRLHGETRKTIVFVTHNIEEAVLLSDAVIVMTPRPGRVRLVEKIELPRPRTIDTRYEAEFAEHSKRIRDAVYDHSS